jgi:lipopolysaccharide biosynthesis protein
VKTCSETEGKKESIRGFSTSIRQVEARQLHKSFFHAVHSKKIELITFPALKGHHPFFLPRLLTYLQGNNGVDRSIRLLPSNSYKTISLISDHILHVRAILTTDLSQIMGAIILLVDISIP